jgi:hypothetical protein
MIYSDKATTELRHHNNTHYNESTDLAMIVARHYRSRPTESFLFVQPSSRYLPPVAAAPPAASVARFCCMA